MYKEAIGRIKNKDQTRSNTIGKDKRRKKVYFEV